MAGSDVVGFISVDLMKYSTESSMRAGIEIEIFDHVPAINGKDTQKVINVFQQDLALYLSKHGIEGVSLMANKADRLYKSLHY